MGICGNSMFDLLRNAFLIPMRFNDKGVTNPVRLTDAEGELIKQTSVNKQISQNNSLNRSQASLFSRIFLNTTISPPCHSSILFISDKRNRKGICFVIHHANPYQIYYEEDILEHRDDIIGHYRIS